MTIKQIQAVYSYLKKQYLVKLPPVNEITTYSDLMNLKLSHLNINILYYTLCININSVTHIEVDSKWMSIDEYKKNIVSLMRYIDYIYFIVYPSILPTLSHKKYRICKSGKVEEPKFINITLPKSISTPKGRNHFRISSFDIASNKAQLSSVLKQLWKYRDDYSTLHFHLEGNTGGDLVPVHLIMLCLCGGRQPWMTDYEVIENDNGIRKWDPWVPWDTNSGYFKQYKDLDIDPPTYTTQYSGKIILHFDVESASSTWFFITYIIYVFAEKIQRFTKYVNGRQIKLGRATGRHIELRGISKTTSGDGNSITKEFLLDGSKVAFKIPTQANISRPIDERDWNRFWMEETADTL